MSKPEDLSKSATTDNLTAKQIESVSKFIVIDNVDDGVDAAVSESCNDTEVIHGTGEIKFHS